MLSSGCDVHECRVLLPEGVRIAWRRVSSWGIRMELLRIAWRRMSLEGIRMELCRIAMRAPCQQGEGSLHLVHADGPPCDARISHSRNSVRSNMSGSSDRIFHIRRLTSDGRGGRFNFPGQTCLDPLIVLTWRASTADNSDYPDFAQCRGVLLKLPDISDRHFGIFCFRYLMSKSPNCPCNPPIIGFLSL